MKRTTISEYIDGKKVFKKISVDQIEKMEVDLVEENRKRVEEKLKRLDKQLENLQPNPAKKFKSKHGEIILESGGIKYVKMMEKLGYSVELMKRIKGYRWNSKTKKKIQTQAYYEFMSKERKNELKRMCKAWHAHYQKNLPVETKLKRNENGRLWRKKVKSDNDKYQELLAKKRVQNKVYRNKNREKYNQLQRAALRLRKYKIVYVCAKTILDI